MKTYPRSPLAPSAQYWVGNAQFARKDYRAAIAAQRQLIAVYPDSPKVPDALLNIAIGAVRARRQRRGAAHARGADRASTRSPRRRARRSSGSAMRVSRPASPWRCPRSPRVLVAWQRTHGRHDLPWQSTRDPYRIWLSEIMLQQTQVATVLPYYARFLAAFPDVARARRGADRRVLEHWSGLGYYRRAHHLHAAAQRDRRRARRRVSARRRDARDAARHRPLDRGGDRRVRVRRARRRSSTATSSACSRAIAASRAGPARRRSKPRCGRSREALLPERRHRGLHAGLDGSRRDGLHARRAALRRVPGRDGLRRAREGRIDELPSPRPAKALPQRAVRVLVIERGGEILLEKRPPLGIWGGLWSLPECALDDDRAPSRARASACERRRSREALPPIAHGFTHFALTMHPQRLGARQAPPSRAKRRASSGSRRDDALAAALPAPIRKLLRSLPASRS